MPGSRPTLTGCSIRPAMFSNGDGETRTLTGCPTRPSNVRVYQFRHIPTNLASFHCYCGEAEGAAGAGLVAGLGEAAGSDKPGVGCAASTGSVTTERGPITPGSEKINASNINRAAATIVAFSRGFCGPRGPKAEWLPAPPNAAATSPPLPDCRSTTRIRKKQHKI